MLRKSRQGIYLLVSIVTLIMLFFAFAPDDPEPFKTGLYRNIKPGSIELLTLYLRYGTTSYTVGSELQVNEDSSYCYITCGNIMTGTWKIKDDSLMLMMETNRWRNDSLNEHGFNGKWPEVYMKPFGFKITGNCLTTVQKYKQGHIDKLELSVGQ
jgi:hypothetical protein